MGAWFGVILLSVALSVASVRAEEVAGAFCTTEKNACDLFRDRCEDFYKEVGSDIDAAMKVKIDGLYEHRNIVFDETEKPKVFPTGGVVCNPARGELTTNRKGESCGEPAVLDGAGAVYVPGSSQTNPGSLENSFMLGAYVAGLECTTRQVLDEMKTGRLAISADVQEKYRSILDLSKKGVPLQKNLQNKVAARGLSEQLCKVARSSGLNGFCKDLSRATAENSELVTFEQAACYVAATGVGVKTAFKLLVQAEIFSRLTASFTPSFVVPGSRFELEFSQRVMKTGARSIVGRAVASCLFHIPPRISPGCVEDKTIRKYQDRYRGAVRPFARDFVSKTYPLTGACYRP